MTVVNKGDRFEWNNEIWTVIKTGIRPNGVRHIDMINKDHKIIYAYDALLMNMKKIEE